MKRILIFSGLALFASQSVGSAGVRAQPEVPTPAAPIGGVGVTTQTPTLHWYPQADADTFVVEYDDEITFTAPNKGVVSGDTSYTVAVTLTEGTWYWRMLAADSLGQRSGYSGIDSFHVDVTPSGIPTPAAPMGGVGVTTQTPTLYWAFQLDADTFIVQYSDEETFASPDSGVVTGDTSHTVPFPLSDGMWYWRVLAVDSLGQRSSFSAADSFCVWTEQPAITALTVDGNNGLLHVTDHTPLIEWDYTDPTSGLPQVAFEIAVGTDNDWLYAEMWNPAPFQTTDTFVTYAGATLLDGETYFVRLRVSNGIQWSTWYEITFRMNSVPSVPICLEPINDEETGNNPTLVVQVSSDAEGDILTYDFYALNDSTCGEPTYYDTTGIPEGNAVAAWQIDTPLPENCRHWWRARAFDGFEHSDWTNWQTFFVNGTPEAPTPPGPQYPPDTAGMPVFDMLPTFVWYPSTDPDPLDTVRYKLEIAVDPEFNYVNTVDSIDTWQYELADSLAFATHYWWRVTAWDQTGMSTMSPNTPDFWTWTLGDVNHDHLCNIVDLTFIVDYLFGGGSAPYPEFVADINGDCDVNIVDLTYLVAYLFGSGEAPRVGC